MLENQMGSKMGAKWLGCIKKKYFHFFNSHDSILPAQICEICPKILCSQLNVGRFLEVGSGRSRPARTWSVDSDMAIIPNMEWSSAY
jgi:hypothetical protein